MLSVSIVQKCFMSYFFTTWAALRSNIGIFGGNCKQNYILKRTKSDKMISCDCREIRQTSKKGHYN